MKLLIVESPAKAKTIAKYLDNAYTVKASVGHIRDLPKSNKKAIDIDRGFLPHYEIVKGKEHIVEEIRELADRADEIVLATDLDREGEAIAWHIKEAVGLSRPKRVVFHEITKDAVQEAIEHPRTIDTDLRRAQEARRVLDRLVGYDLSGLIWKKVRYGLSAGRVQSPALRILVEREREIKAFKPEHYFIITAQVETVSKENLVLTSTEEPRDQNRVNEIITLGKNHPWKINDVAETEVKRAPRAPFITSTLQQAASSRLGFSPARTMAIAQRLYERGFITYMRTDSTSLSAVALKQIETTVKKAFGDTYYEPHTFSKKSKNAQEAHEAIRPTNCTKAHAGTTPEQKKLYELIWGRTIASQMAPAKLMRTKVTAGITGGPTDTDFPPFTITGSRVTFDGWLRADPRARGEDVEIPKVKNDDPLTLQDIASEEKETQPPSRYTEAGLVKELEKRGIGRPSTYASIMKTLEDRGYVEKINRSLKPTDTGEVVSSFLEENFTTYVSDSFTAEMEDKLDDIAEGKREYEETLATFYTPFHKEVSEKEKTAKITTLGEAPQDIRCPKCKSAMVIKLGRGGKFLSCNTFPTCDGMRTLEGKEIEPSKPIGTHPETQEPIFLLDGRFGPYLQLGEKTKTNKKPRRASIPKEMDPAQITMKEALKLLSLPRILGTHPTTGNEITANIGRFGPYIVHDGDFRSLKEDDVYTIELPRALEILKEEKVRRRRGTKKGVKK